MMAMFQAFIGPNGQSWETIWTLTSANKTPYLDLDMKQAKIEESRHIMYVEQNYKNIFA
jgi:hypothetical protein